MQQKRIKFILSCIQSLHSLLFFAFYNSFITQLTLKLVQIQPGLFQPVLLRNALCF